MAKTQKVSKQEFDSEEVIEVLNSDSGERTTSGLGRKHVALDQLPIIKEYIDRKNALQDSGMTSTGSIMDVAGVNGLRVIDGKLQYLNGDAWLDVKVSSGGVSPDISSAEVADDQEVSDLFGV